MAVPNIKRLFAVFICFTSMTTASDKGQQITKEDLLEGLRFGQKYVQDLEALERNMLENDRGSVHKASHGYTYAHFKPSSPEAVAQSKKASVQLMAREYLTEKFNISTDRINFDDHNDRTSGGSGPIFDGVRRTVVFIKRTTVPGEDIFLRGGIDGSRRSPCSSAADGCSLPMTTAPLGTTAHFSKYNAWRIGDTKLDWFGAEPGQGQFSGIAASGTPMVWTSNIVGNPGYQSLNTFGDHYWMLDMELDCSKTEGGWFEVKTFGPNSVGWEVDINQPACTGTAGGVKPFNSINHVARCGYVNVFESGKGNCIINSLPKNCPINDPIAACFRSLDGSCNNPDKESYGQARTIFQRLINSVSYKDGIGQPRDAPSARAVSLGVVVNESLPNYDVSLMMMQFGQFLDHDLTLSPSFTRLDGGPISCCSSSQFGEQLISSSLHPQCMPITIPSDDPIYSPNNNCMQFVRSTFGNNLDGSTPPFRQQINALTHWLDGSNIYGSSSIFADSLRDKSSGLGKMKISTSPTGRPLLPTSTCPSCFVAGDVRVNEQPLLTVMHTLFVREHNRIAEKLKSNFPGRSDEFRYQNTRALVIAEWQHIVYNEYLPILIGPDLAARAKAPRGSDPPGDPAIFNEFATAAFRMGHSMLKSFIRLLDNDGALTKRSYFLSDSFLTAERMLETDYLDSALRGLMGTPVQKVDHCFPDDVTSQLFKPPGSGNRGFDLISRNIQRGRDHGLLPYADYFTAIQLSNYGYSVPLNSFSDLSEYMDSEVIKYLRNTYASVKDVDLFIGGVSEKPVPGGLVGPTFAGIIAQQFRNLKQADRFFYDDLSQPGVSLSAATLTQIKKTTLAGIICDNSDGTITKIQPKVFLSPNMPGNEPVPCSSIPRSI